MKAKKNIKCVDEFTYKLVNRKPFKKSFTSNMTGKLSLLSKTSDHLLLGLTCKFPMT